MLTENSDHGLCKQIVSLVGSKSKIRTQNTADYFVEISTRTVIAEHWSTQWKVHIAETKPDKRISCRKYDRREIVRKKSFHRKRCGYIL